jgi:hypothetical protein
LCSCASCVVLSAFCLRWRVFLCQRMELRRGSGAMTLPCTRAQIWPHERTNAGAQTHPPTNACAQHDLCIGCCCEYARCGVVFAVDYSSSAVQPSTLSPAASLCYCLSPAMPLLAPSFVALATPAVCGVVFAVDCSSNAVQPPSTLSPAPSPCVSLQWAGFPVRWRVPIQLPLPVQVT